MKASLLLFLALSAASCFASTTCQSQFQVGQLEFCVTENGNIASFYDGTISNGAEGYGICAPGGPYYDLGRYGDSGNWLPATITQPKGPNTFPLTITRYTADGVFRVIQSFSFAAGGSNVLVKVDVLTFTLFNPDITFFRYSDPPTFPSDNTQYGGQSGGTAFVWNRGGSGFTATVSSPNRSQRLLIVGGAPSACNWQIPAIPYTGDSATLLQWPWNGGHLKLSFNYGVLR